MESSCVPQLILIKNDKIYRQNKLYLKKIFTHYKIYTITEHRLNNLRDWWRERDVWRHTSLLFF